MNVNGQPSHMKIEPTGSTFDVISACHQQTLHLIESVLPHDPSDNLKVITPLMVAQGARAMEMLRIMKDS